MKLTSICILYKHEVRIALSLISGGRSCLELAPMGFSAFIIRPAWISHQNDKGRATVQSPKSGRLLFKQLCDSRVLKHRIASGCLGLDK